MEEQESRRPSCLEHPEAEVTLQAEHKYLNTSWLNTSYAAERKSDVATTKQILLTPERSV
jgi:hypothetical protein